MIYQPPPVKAPLLRRTASWSGGNSVALLIAVSFLAIPIIYFVVIAAITLEAFLEAL